MRFFTCIWQNLAVKFDACDTREKQEHPAVKLARFADQHDNRTVLSKLFSTAYTIQRHKSCRCLEWPVMVYSKR